MPRNSVGWGSRRPIRYRDGRSSEDAEGAHSGRSLVASRYVGPEARREVLGDRPGGTSADGPAVELGDAYHLGGRTGQEDLVGGVEIVAVERQLFSGVAGFARQLDHGVARYPTQNPGVRGRRAHDAARHREQVHAARLRDVTTRVEHDHLVRRGGDAFELRQDVGEVVERLDPGGEAFAVVNRCRGSDGSQALLITV